MKQSSLFSYGVLILIIGIIIYYNFNQLQLQLPNSEGFTANPGLIKNYNFDTDTVTANTKVNDENNTITNDSDGLISDIYPAIGKNQISNENASKIWWKYPTFKLGSYEQITNNIRYSNSPDVGRCTPASMCGALYNNKNLGVNTVKQLPLVKPDCGTRVGYFSATDGFFPFRTNIANVLY